MLDIEFKYYREKHSDLLKKYRNKYIVIKGKKVLGAYASHSQAYDETVQTEELGTFLIHHCLSKKGSHIVVAAMN